MFTLYLCTHTAYISFLCIMLDTGNIRTTAVVITSNSIDFILSDVNQNYECTITPQDAIEMQVTILKHGSGVFRGLQPNTKYRLKCEGLRNNCSVNITSFRTRIGGMTAYYMNTVQCSIYLVAYSWNSLVYHIIFLTLCIRQPNKMHTGRKLQDL